MEDICNVSKRYQPHTNIARTTDNKQDLRQGHSVVYSRPALFIKSTDTFL